MYEESNEYGSRKGAKKILKAQRVEWLSRFAPYVFTLRLCVKSPTLVIS